MWATTKKETKDQILVNIISCWSVGRVASHSVLYPLPLIYTNVVDKHLSRKFQILEVGWLKVERHCKIHNDVLNSSRSMGGHTKSGFKTYHGLFGNQSLRYLRCTVRSYKTRSGFPRPLVVIIPCNVPILSILRI